MIQVSAKLITNFQQNCMQFDGGNKEISSKDTSNALKMLHMQISLRYCVLRPLSMAAARAFQFFKTTNSIQVYFTITLWNLRR